MKQFEYMTPETVVKTYQDAKTGYTTANGRLERVEKFDTLLDGNAARSKITDFRTALPTLAEHTENNRLEREFSLTAAP